MSAHIVTMGGGGFGMSESKSATAFDRYLLELSGKANPLVCFAPTASADSPDYINKFLVAYGALGVRTMVLTLWDEPRQSIERLPEADVVFVGGGNTVNMMALWDAHGVSPLLREFAASSDKVLSGLSAGANCWFEACSTDSFGTNNEPWRGGLGVLPGSFCPHFDGEPMRAPEFSAWVADGSLPDGWAADDGAAIVFSNGQPVEFIAERRGAKVYRIESTLNPGSSGVLSQPQEMQLL